MLAGLDSFVIDAIEEIDNDEMELVVKSIVTCSVELIAGLARIMAERDSRNDVADTMPPVLPRQLLKLRGKEFAGIIWKQKDRLAVY